MTFRTLPAPELLTFKHWYTSVSDAMDGSSFPSGTYSEYQPSSISTKGGGGTVGVKSFDLTVTVLKSRSWIVDAKATTALLEHERLHFLIAICVGRDLHEDAHSATAPSTGMLQSALARLLKEARARAQQISDRYDQETANGSRLAQQAVWDTRIRRWHSIGFKEW